MKQKNIFKLITSLIPVALLTIGCSTESMNSSSSTPSLLEESNERIVTVKGSDPEEGELSMLGGEVKVKKEEAGIIIREFFFTHQSGYVVPEESYFYALNYRGGVANIKFKEGLEKEYTCIKGILLGSEADIFVPQEGIDAKVAEVPEFRLSQDGGLSNLAVAEGDSLVLFHLDRAGAIQAGGGNYISAEHKKSILETVDSLIEEAIESKKTSSCDSVKVENKKTVVAKKRIDEKNDPKKISPPVSFCPAYMPGENLVKSCNKSGGQLLLLKDSFGCDSGECPIFS